MMFFSGLSRSRIIRNVSECIVLLNQNIYCTRSLKEARLDKNIHFYWRYCYVTWTRWRCKRCFQRCQERRQKLGPPPLSICWGQGWGHHLGQDRRLGHGHHLRHGQGTHVLCVSKTFSDTPLRLIILQNLKLTLWLSASQVGQGWVGDKYCWCSPQTATSNSRSSHCPEKYILQDLRNALLRIWETQFGNMIIELLKIWNVQRELYRKSLHWSPCTPAPDSLSSWESETKHDTTCFYKHGQVQWKFTTKNKLRTQ